MNYIQYKMIYCKGKKDDGSPCGQQARWKFKGKGQYCNKCKAPNMTDDKTKYCIVGNCDTGASFSLNNQKPETHCLKCITELGVKNPLNLKKRVCLGINNAGCKDRNSPSFDFPGVKTPKYCNTCKAPGMIDVVHDKCVICKKVSPCYGLEDLNKRTHCAGCAKKSDEPLVFLSSTICNGITEGKKCTTIATFGFENNKAIKCDKHKELGMKSLKGQRCIVCGKRASFGVLGTKKLTHCKKDAPPGYVAVGETRICTTSMCGTRYSYGFIWDEKPSKCAKCADEGMEDLVKKRCVKCLKTVPSYIVPGEKTATYCVGCSDPTMTSIHKKCEICNDSRACYGYREDGIRKYCEKDQKEGMFYLDRPKCEDNSCIGYAKYGYLFQKKQYCFIHKKNNMHPENMLYPICKDESCKKIPYYCEEGKRYPTHCEIHKPPGYVNIVERKCNNCFLLDFIPQDKNVCRDCDIWSDTQVRHEKELRIKHVLEANGIEYYSHDRVPKFSQNKYRPDFILDFASMILILEVDENQHHSYSCECEEKRMTSLKQDFKDIPLVFIRYNPDDYKNEAGEKIKGKNFNNDREGVLIKLIKHIRDNAMIGKYELLFLSVYYLYYDGFDGRIYRSSVNLDNQITNDLPVEF